MKKSLITLMLLLPFAVYAQQQSKGTVKDANDQPLDAVTITLSQLTNNIAYALSDSGKFAINYKTGGKYTLTANLIGYKPVVRQIQLPQDSLIITMQPDSKQLSVVTISAAKPIIERSIDRVTFNVENSIVASGGTAWEALGKAPGVMAGANGTLSADKKSVHIYMDGKPLNLSGDDLANYLQGLPADLVSKIEVFANPPANFDAEGGAVINIVTKKAKGQGFNMTLNGGYSQGIYSSYTASSSFNYRKDKLNVYGSYGYSDRQTGRNQDDYVTYAAPGKNSYWNSPGYDVFHSKSDNYRLGADYQLTGNQVLGVLITGFNSDFGIMTNTPTTVTNNNYNKTTLDSTLLTNGQTNTHSNKIDYNLNYNIKLDTSGESFNVDVDYSPFRAKPHQYVSNFTYLPDGNLASRPYQIYTPTLQNINIYSGKIDYNYKPGKIWTLSSGLKYSSIQSKNNFDFYNIAGPQPELITANSDHFDYTENTAAAYTSITGSFGRWTFEGGLRGEFTHTRGFSETLDSLNKKKYFKLFPTLYTVYKLDDENQLQATYSYRVDRPGYALLNPAKHYATPYSYLQGNPDLQPAFIRDIELGYTFKQEYNITAFYTATHGRFSNITVQDNTHDLFHDTFQNLGLSSNMGLNLSAPVHVSDWWDMTCLVSAYVEHEASQYLQGSYNYHKFSYDGSTTQSFTINKKMGLKAEITARYSGPEIQGIFKQEQNSEVDAGIKATVLHGQGTIKLAANDIFYGNTYHVKVNYLNQNNGFIQTNDSRNGTLSFSYRFGNTVKAARKRATADEEESKRAQ